MGSLGKSAWAKSTLRTDSVEVPDLEGEVRIRELPASYVAEINRHVELIQVGREQKSHIDLQAMERLKFAYGVIDDEGEQLFSEEEVKDIAKNHGRAFRTVVDAIDKLSDLGQEGTAAAEARFPGSGVRANGKPVSDSEADGGSGPPVPARAGA